MGHTVRAPLGKRVQELTGSLRASVCGNFPGRKELCPVLISTPPFSGKPELTQLEENEVHFFRLLAFIPSSSSYLLGA